MKKNIYYAILPFAMKCIGSINDFPKTIASVFRILLCSKLRVSIKSGKYHTLKRHPNCTILANGPSLKAAIENNEVRLSEADVFCVNSFCESDYFWQIKPNFYFLVDIAFFNPTDDRTKKQVQTLVKALNNVNWEMHLCITSNAVHGGVLEGLNNNLIKVIEFNTTTCNGWGWFNNLIYRWRLGMPQCMNVTNFCIMAAMIMKYKNVYLYGIDHNFSAQVFVGDDNRVYSTDKHVYGSNTNARLMPDTTIATVLAYSSKAFVSHERLEQYSKRVGIKIYNCTRGSFVDAYERLR